MRSSASCLRALAARFFCACLTGMCAGGTQAGGVYVFADQDGGWVLRDAPGEPGWQLLLAIEEPGARTMPREGPDTCRSGRGALPAWHGEIEAAAARARVDPDLVKAVVYVESRCNPRALSPRGARGLMQLMPGTAARYGVADAFDPVQNLSAGARLLRDLLAAFSGNLELALAAYNAGPKAVVDARMRIPPFRETRAYVPAVLERLRRLRSDSTGR